MSDHVPSSIDGHILEFPTIRIDSFTQPTFLHPHHLPSLHSPFPLLPAPPAQLYLLTHSHTDHLTGLTGNFQGEIWCSLETKKLVLGWEGEGEREGFDRGGGERRVKKFGGLEGRRVRKIGYANGNGNGNGSENERGKQEQQRGYFKEDHIVSLVFTFFPPFHFSFSLPC